MADFIVAYKKLNYLEGGYSNNSLDHGGETFRGISRPYNKDWSGWKTIDSMKSDPTFPSCLEADAALQEAVVLFYENKWHACGASVIEDQALSELLFDVSINAGVGRGVMILQGVLNILNRNQQLWPDIKEDGGFGIRTAQALAACKEIELLRKVIFCEIGHFYKSILQADPTQEVFARGWFNRLNL